MIDIDARSIFALGLAVLGATLISFVLYRRTSPTLPFRLRLLLGSLRWLAAFLLLAMVIDPAMRFVMTRSSTPVIGVLVDDSKSMAYPDPQMKIDEVKSVLSGAFVAALDRKAQLRFFTFSDTLGHASIEKIRGLAPRGSRTDLVSGITSALKSIEAKPSAFVLLSDGGVNFGEDALHFCSSLKVPMYPVSVARREPTPDVSIDRIETSEVAYAGSDVPAAIYLSGRLPNPIETTLVVRDSTGEVFRTPVTIPGSGARQKIVTDLEAGEIGIHGFTAALAAFKDERVVSNNSMAFSIKVMKGKIRVALVAPHPSWDFAFARRSLGADPNIELSIVFRPGSAMAVKSDRVTNDLRRAISDCDVAVIMRDVTLGSAAQELEQFVWKGGATLLISPDRSVDIAEDMNPFVVTRASGQARSSPLYSPILAEAGTDHEIMDIEIARGGRVWSSLPPVPVDNSITGAKKEASVLLSGVRGPGAGGETEVPLMSAMRYGMGRVVGFAGCDLWRWDLVPKSFGVETSAFSELLISSIRWLVQGEEAKRLGLSTTKNAYFWGEPIAILGRVVDENLKPQPHAVVESRIYDRARGKMILEASMVEKSAGSHSQIVDLLPPSQYMVKATARLDGQVYAEDMIYFTVSERGLEDSDFDGDGALLEEIARATGGRVYTAEGAARLPADLNPGSVIVKTSKDLRFRLSVASFIVLAGLLGAEWLVRRRKMLA
jgi:hypothetical protein